ncbi:hypothetical protein [Amycolatopsis sp. NPDC059657]|uniref:hypothetical protein n=1 Tax=Amycolatopsis sp. NPDC059657 TaxID=3346899 RepID=UPI0036706153
MIDKIKHTGDAASRVAEGIRGVDCAATVPGGDAGIPGSASMAKLAAVKQAWQSREQSFVSLLETHSASIDKAVQLYRSNEQA